MSKISVIIPVYNNEKYLRKCLDSVIGQTLNDIEIICINDCSTDSSPEILNEYAQKDSRIKLFNTLKNSNKKGRVSAARNIGLKNATGEFIGFVDSDDYIDTDFYEKLYKKAIEYECEAVYGNIICHRPKETKYLIKYDKTYSAFERNSKTALAYIPLHNFIWNKIYKREYILKNEIFFNEDRIYEDVDWSIRAIFYADKACTITNSAYHYNKCNSNSCTSDAIYFNDGIWAAKSRYQFAREHNIVFRNFYKRYIRIFGMKILKIYPYYSHTLIKLFGFIPVISIEN